MNRATRGLLLAGGTVLAGLWCSCGSSVGPNDKPPPPPPPPAPFNAFSLVLRPLSIQRPSDVGGSPNPTVAVYNLSAFYCGGKAVATFQWQVPPLLGTLGPKADSLSSTDATVALRPADRPPLGLHTVRAVGRSGEETDSVVAQFAVIESTWMKHKRATFANLLNEPEDLVQSPVWIVNDNRTARDDSILYVEFPSVQTVKLKRIAAYRPLSAAERQPEDANLLPDLPDPQTTYNFDIALNLTPDPAPLELGRHEILFSSTMDLRYPERCRIPTACSAYFPQNIWVVRAPGPFKPAPLTSDSTLMVGGVTKFYAFDYRMPRWDPTTPRGSRLARIAFMSNLGNGAGSGAGRLDLWLADLEDRDGDGRTDALVNYRRLTTNLGLTSFAWHPDGNTIYFTGGPQALGKIDVGSGAIEKIVLPDTLHVSCLPDHNDASRLGSFASVTVFHRAGENTLIAFQATQENLVNLYVFDEQAHTLTRLLPFSIPVTTNLFPRWHPLVKELAYVSDYSVGAWSDAEDKPPPSNPEIYGQKRTLYPSVWSIRLEEVP